jgi:Transglycosylase SLT domain
MSERPGTRSLLVLFAGAGALVATLLTGLAALAATRGASDSATAQASAPSAAAESQIPPEYLRLYQQAAARYGLDWTILAGIGKVECDHGRDPDPSCTQEGAVNSAGAGGPMQFLATTWAQYGVDGDGDGRVDRWDPADAIYGAANYLRASGAPGNYREAIFAYNHAGWYVNEVEHWAAVYRGSAQAGTEGAAGKGAEGAAGDGEVGVEGAAEEDAEAGVGLSGYSSTPIEFTAGERAVLSPSDGHVALIPAQAPTVVQAMVIAGNELQELPYGPDGHPDPRGALSEDCSSTVNYVLFRSGVRPIAEIVRENPLAQDYVDWGLPGPGRWVSIYATTTPTDHVFIVIGGLRLDTSHDGTDVGPNRDQDGPRWRILDRIPDWAHWSVRHPVGL